MTEFLSLAEKSLQSHHEFQEAIIHTALLVRTEITAHGQLHVSARPGKPLFPPGEDPGLLERIPQALKELCILDRAGLDPARPLNGGGLITSPNRTPARKDAEIRVDDVFEQQRIELAQLRGESVSLASIGTAIQTRLAKRR